MNVLENYLAVRESVRLISGSLSNSTKIIAISKTVSGTTIQEAINCGITLLGESKVQEAKRKISSLTGEFSFHMIGHLQSNKARDAVALFDVIQTIDKVSTAQAVNQEAEKINKKQKIMIQINASGESSKSGVQPSEALFLAEEIIKLSNIELIGLMTIAPFTDNDDIIRQSFRTTKKMLDEINTQLKISMRELSMGMSSDFPIAIEEGATMIRIGTAIFGDRQYQ